MVTMTQRKNLLLLLVLCLLLTGCTPGGATGAPTVEPVAAPTAEPTAAPERVSAVGFYFDTAVTLTLFEPDEQLLSDIWAACARYENLLSKTVEGSDVDRINRAGGETVTVDADTWAILQEAKAISSETGHAFSITIAPLSAMWDFTGGTHRMPTDEERLAALPLVNDDALTLGEGCTVTLPAGMSIDLGGIAKGYIADRVAELCRSRCTGAIINLGGNTYVVGHKPDGTPYRVGVQDPNGQTGDPLAALTLQEGTVVTSGVYERYFEVDGVRYHHILDPKTGSSAVTDLVSATVLADSSMEADALATACIVLGSEQALALLKSKGVDGLLIRADGSMLETEGFTEAYSMQMLN